jgi:formylglycine-generating enzyme required for sulfatase activity
MTSKTPHAPTYALLVLSAIVFSASGLAMAADIPRTYTNSIGMKFVLIPAGTFMMGEDKIIKEAADDEKPPHQVKISKPFYLGVYEVTQEVWESLMRNNPSKFRGRDNPVDQVSWDDAQDFITRLNKKEGHSRYRLPTEAEWEYAVRAGSTGTYYFADDGSQIRNFAWYDGNSGNTTRPVGQKRPNAWGLYDMLGNVWEWTADWYGETYYANSPDEDPTGPESGFYRVYRGGSWSSSASFCRSADRDGFLPETPDASRGFRLALSPEDGK